MIIKELKMKNFGIYYGEHCLDLRCDEGRNIILIGGMNGRGKTTILEAVLLALYGKRSMSFTEHNTSYTEYLRNYINNVSNGETFLELSIELYLGQERVDILIRRSWTEGKRISDNLEVWKNAIPDKYLARHWDTYVEEILPSGVASLFFFNGEKISRLAGEETDEEMKRSIKALLGLDIIGRTITDVRRISKRKQKQVPFIKDNDEIKNLNDELNDIKTQLNRCRSDMAQLKERKEKYQKRLAREEDKFAKYGGFLGLDRQELVNEKEKLLVAVEEAKRGLVELASGAMPLLLLKPQLEKLYNTNKEEEMIKSARYGKALIENVMTRFVGKLETSGIDDDIQAELATFFNDEIRYIEELSDKKQVFSLSPFASQLIDSLLFDDFNYILKESSRRINEYRRLENSLEQVERHLLVEVDENETDSLLNNIKKLIQRTAETENHESFLQKEIERLESLENNLEISIDKLIRKVIDERDSREDAARIIKYANLTAEVLYCFQQKILENKVQNLAKKITKCFNCLSHKNNLWSKVQIDPNTLKMNLYDSSGKFVLKFQLSSGEKQMLAVSILWSLAQYSGLSLPVIIDTPLGRLDSSHRSNFLTKYLPNAGHQVIVLSTDEEINGAHLKLLEDHIYKKYFLQYHEGKKATKVVEGYFTGDVS
ncbi:MAG: DNA sulfur modification protein DndD [Fastidiosipilaceae bacterium]|jgi:DNA sulfur modification protein DndD